MLETNTRVAKEYLINVIYLWVVSATSIIFSKYLPEKQANVSTKVYGEERTLKTWKYFGELCRSCFQAWQPSWLFLSEIKKTMTWKILYIVDKVYKGLRFILFVSWLSHIVRSLSVFLVTGRIQAPIFACSLFLTYKINLVVNSSEMFFSALSKKAWKIKVICINSKWLRQVL